MPDVIKVRAATNNEVAFLSWDIDGMIPGCLGFEIVRIYPDTGEERCLAAWVPFKGQRNPRWIPQDTGVWPVQKTSRPHGAPPPRQPHGQAGRSNDRLPRAPGG